MYGHIMVPVDLAHMDKLERALAVVRDLASLWGAGVTYVGVTSDAPGALGHNPAEYRARLEKFAAGHGGEHGQAVGSKMVIANDPTAELDDALLGAVKDLGADLVVMASHKPGFKEHIWPSNGGRLASHAGISVMLVRD